MTFIDWLKTATKRDGTPLSARTADHYADGFKVISDEMLKNNIVDKKLEDMALYELDLAIAIIFKNDDFIAKDKKGKGCFN